MLLRKPDLFIVGAPRCGTTAMYMYLRAHPEIFMSPEKEPQYFVSDLTVRSRPTLEEYLAYFAGAGEEKRVGEATAIYLYSKSAAGEIKEFSPAAYIIAMLRNPVDFLYSAHSRLLIRQEDITDFEAALGAEEWRKQGMKIPPRALSAEALFYRDLAKFSEQLERYYDIFGKEKVTVIIYDDLRDDTAGVYRNTLEFLEVDPDFQTDLKVVNPNTKLRSVLLDQALAKSTRMVNRRFGSGSLQARALGKVNKSLVKWNETKAYRPPMDPQLRKRLLTEFVPEVERLSALLGRDLTHWSRQ